MLLCFRLPQSRFPSTRKIPMHTASSRHARAWRRRLPLAAALLLASVSCGDRPTGPAAVERVDVTAPAASVPAGDTLTLSAVARDGDGNALAGRGITWSSDNPAVLKVDGAGRASGESPGTATVTAQSEGKIGTLTITVTGARVTSIVLARDTATLVAGTTLQLNANTRDRFGSTLAGRAVAWASSAQGVAQVDAAGKVTAVGPGTAVITASSEGATAQATVTVLPAPIASLTIAPDTATLVVGATLPLAITARDAAGNVLPGREETLVSSSGAVATLAGSTVHAVAPGTATITATAEGKTATATITVVPVPIATLAFVPDSVGILVGGQAQLRLVARDAAGNELPGRPATVENGNPAVVSLTPELLATGLAPGVAVLTATAEGKTATAKIVVSPVPVATVVVSPDSARLVAGATVDLSAAAYDANGNLLTGRGVSWFSDNPAVASVTATGVVTAVSAGVADVYATVEGKTDAARITVVVPPDTTEPTLNGLTTTPGAVDVSFGPQTVTVRAAVADAGSGVAMVGGSFRSPSGAQGTPALSSSQPVSGTRASGVFEISFPIPAAAEAGDWTLGLVVHDMAGNVLPLTSAELQARGLPYRVAVASGTPDNTAPTLTGLVIEPASVDVSTSSGAFVVRVTATDAGAGLGLVGASFRSPSGTQNTPAHGSSTLVSGTRANGTVEIGFSIPARAEGGNWTLLLTLRDQVGNLRVYQAADLQAGGFPSFVQVVSPIADTSPPSLHGVTITPLAVNVASGPATVTVRADVSDAGVGVGQVDGYFQSPSGAQRTAVMSSFTPVSGTRASGSFEVSWSIPAGAEPGDWKLQLTVRDQVGNMVSLSPAQLEALGFPNKVTVSN